MTPLLFISIVAVVLTMLVYWVLNTLEADEKRITRPIRFDFEAAPELALNTAAEFYLARNTIKIQRNDDEYGLVYWNLSRAKWEEICSDCGVSPDMRHIVLRVNEAGEQLQFSDMWVKTIAGQCRFRLQPQKAYYATLGIKRRNRFIPILTSSTIMRQS
ncbi:MAG: hypothetical protein CVU90_02560 [Firmicutes bacterium HGW-Firmicutes-15]|nr:MAG: hypothetical protein CVU90_02560 [Firmicutes bacterium HGW-Firmicutes-15]